MSDADRKRILGIGTLIEHTISQIERKIKKTPSFAESGTLVRALQDLDMANRSLMALLVDHAT